MTTKEYAQVGKDVSVVDVGEQLMEFYIRTIVEAKLPAIRKAAIAANPQVDADYVSSLINNKVEQLIPEVRYKFNQVAILLIDFLVRGQEGMVRDFGTKFEDLMERTLLRNTDWNSFLSSFRQQITDIINKSSGNGIDNPIGNA